MPRHLIAPTSEFPPGTRRLVTVNGRAIVVFNVNGEYLALLNRCPHNGGSLVEGALTGLLEASEPGEYRYSRQGEIIRCPWHGWEFDLRTGRSFCSGLLARARPIKTGVDKGSAILEGPYRAETIPVRVEEEYVFLEV